MARRPLTDSPWFWLYAFTAFGLGLVIWSGPTWIQRQARLERRGEGWAESRDSTGREAGEEVAEVDAPVSGEPESGELVGDDRATSLERSHQRLRQLLALLTVIMGLGWSAMLWRARRRRMGEDEAETSSDLFN